MKLTDKRVARMKHRTGRTLDIRWDSVLKNFGVRIYPTNSKSFILAYTDSGRYRVRVIGSAEQFTCEQARAEAARILQKHDSRQKSKLLKEFEPNLTLNDLGRLWLENYAKLHKKSWPTDESRLARYVAPTIGGISLHRLTACDIIGLHASLTEKTPVEANRVLVLIKAMINKAKLWGVYDGPNPAAAVSRNKEEPRRRWVTFTEMPQLLRAIQEEQNLYAQKAILLYLLIGCRKSEVLKARWCDVDFSAGTLYLPTTKTGRGKFRVLSEDALNILRSIPHQEGNPFIIVGKGPEGHLVNIRKAWLRVRTRAGLNDVTLHDLRRTFASWLRNAGQSVDDIRDALGQVDARSTLGYAYVTDQNLRKAVNDHGRAIMALMDSAKKELH